MGCIMVTASAVNKISIDLTKSEVHAYHFSRAGTLCIFVKQNDFASLADVPDDFGINYSRCSLSSSKQNRKHKLLYQTVKLQY